MSSKSIGKKTKKKKKDMTPKIDRCCCVDRDAGVIVKDKRGVSYRTTARGTHPGGRPSKISRALLDALKDMTETEKTYYTDIEIYDMWMERVPKKDRISMETYVEWKNQDTSAKTRLQHRELFEEFEKEIKRTQRQCKANLIEVLKAPEDAATGTNKIWQSRAWLLERKFNDMRQRNHVDVTTAGDRVAAPVIYLPDNGT